MKKIMVAGMMLISLAGCNKSAADKTEEKVAKAEIEADCSLNGANDYNCHFSNKGNAEGSICGHLLLQKTPNAAGVFMFEHPKLMDSAGWALFRFLIAETEEKKSGINIDSYEDIASAFREFAKAEAAGKNGIAGIVYLSKGQGLSDEICSGLVRAGDMREVNGYTVFMDGINNNTVSRLCYSADRLWTDVCDFKFASSEEVKNTVVQEIAITNKIIIDDKKPH